MTIVIIDSRSTGITQEPTDHPRIGTNPSSPMNRQCVTWYSSNHAELLRVFLSLQFHIYADTFHYSRAIQFLCLFFPNISTKKGVTLFYYAYSEVLLIVVKTVQKAHLTLDSDALDDSAFYNVTGQHITAIWRSASSRNGVTLGGTIHSIEYENAVK